MPPLSSQTRGFTLLEQAIIIAVLGALSVIAIPNISRMLDRAKLDQAIAEIRGALDETQREAIRSNKVCDLTLNLIAGEVTGSCLLSGNRSIPQDLDIATNLVQASGITHDQGPIVADRFSGTRHHTVTTDFGFDIGVVEHGQPVKLALLATKPTQTGRTLVGTRLKIISRRFPDKPVTYPLLVAMGGNGNDENPPGYPFSPSPSPSPSGQTIPIQFGVLGNPQFEIESSLTVPEDPSAKIVLFLPDHPSIPKKCVAISNSLGLIRIGRYEGETEPAAITDSGVCRAENWESQ